jgi:hypothetical protein
MSFGEGAAPDLSTLRGKTFPTIRQFTVVLENRVGQLLMEVLRRFEGSQVRIVALSINDATECSVVRMILSYPDIGREILERAGLAIIETELVGVALDDEPNPILSVCSALMQAEINIIQITSLLGAPGRRKCIALMVDNLHGALETLRQKEIDVISEEDLAEE